MSDDNNTVQSFIGAVAQCNSNLPSLYNLAVETIKTFVNPGIEELRKILLEDSSKSFQTNNTLRCIAEESVQTQISELRDEIENVQNWVETSRARAHDHKNQILEKIKDSETVIFDCVGQDNGKLLYDRVTDLEDMMDTMNDKIDRILWFVDAKERKRMERNERKRERAWEKRQEEADKKKAKI